MALNDTTLNETQAQSRAVTSSQKGPHTNLRECVKRHRRHDFEKPVAAHSKAAFDQLTERIAQHDRPLILDSGCGTGDSTRKLAAIYPDHLVIGVDKSQHRLTRQEREPLPENAHLVRADLMDVYRLAHAAGWKLDRHFILYPNPWPKPAHLMRRWHASPVFPAMVALGGRLELRTNWFIYAEECQLALRCYDIPASLQNFVPHDEDYLTLFERKYHLSGQVLYRLVAKVGSLT